MSPGENPANTAAAARQRAARARAAAGRAHRAADVQDRAAAATGRDVHRRLAAGYRRVALVQNSAAELHEAYARRMTAWSRRKDPRPEFMSGVADACGSRGACMTLVSRGGGQLAVAASDGAAREAQELEFMLDEGPARDAVGWHAPVLMSGPPAIEHRWPGYGPELAALGFTGVAAVPLEAADLCVGALTLYDPDLSAPAFSGSAWVAEALTHTVLLGPDAEPELYGDADHRHLVYEAAVAHAERAGLAAADALDLIKAVAFAEGRSTESVARRVLAHDGELPGRTG
ncbi:GAF domain-containing protein [Streptomyces sp. MS06]|uniref:GAF domain-containing protein n=1 Tax=Streptomyces sp. MS06 TaxID=3385974 RepID=UPI0039A125C8